MMFADYEIPVAHSMVKFAAELRSYSAHPLPEFTCYWAAFNNIYVMIAEQQGKKPRLKKKRDGSLCTRMVAQVNIPVVSVLSEREQIDLAFQQFTNKLKGTLVEHPSTRFFVYRTPRWRGKTISDINGQRLNGVLNIGYTVDEYNPVWSPIDTQSYEQYVGGVRDAAKCDALSRQILQVLYTVRNNTFHGGKSTDDANDTDVLQHAVPLLKMIVKTLM
ncbi:MAG: hypothetical protein ACYDBT_10035 [Desulfobulbaceae bacterium]